ncbi:hypothetical protein GCM10009838_77140 [Catenulispora subtropica]|uniref:Uncharacterized protein n=1 Tax=Catenulispora subtropica TaxID=450798 RepID=A0ABN2T6P1_9ACTN
MYYIARAKATNDFRGRGSSPLMREQPRWERGRAPSARHDRPHWSDTLSDSYVILSSRRDPPCDSLHKN